MSGRALGPKSLPNKICGSSRLRVPCRISQGTLAKHKEKRLFKRSEGEARSVEVRVGTFLDCRDYW